MNNLTIKELHEALGEILKHQSPHLTTNLTAVQVIDYPDHTGEGAFRKVRFVVEEPVVATNK